MTPWLHVIGLGADGPAGLAPPARAALTRAEVVIGGARHHALTSDLAAERLAWPSPFDALVPRIAALRGRRVAVLVSGDPLWFSAGETLARAFPGEAAFHPAPSAFQLAAAALGWSMREVECLSLHGRPVAAIIPALAPGQRILCLTSGPETPAEVARILTKGGWGPSRLTVLSDIGGPHQDHMTATAADWTGPAPALHVLAVDCVAGPDARILHRAAGLPDVSYASDGNMTKAEMRAAALSALAPRAGAVLWDVGCGSGTVAVDYLRLAPRARVYGVEPRADRRAHAAANAGAMGLTGLTLIDGAAPDALAGLPPPDAVFFGGGLTEPAFDIARAALNPFGRIVAHAVTPATEALILALQSRHGGDLARIAVSRAEPVGGTLIWRALAPVTQWTLAT